MDFELEQIFEKVSGENLDNRAQNIVTESDKAQIEFAFDEIFSGLSVMEWMKNIQLIDAWKIALDKLRDFVFSIQEQSYIVDYLRPAVFQFRKKQIKQTLQSSIHANEYMHYPKSEHPKIEESAKQKIQTGIDIIKSLVSSGNYQYGAKHVAQKNKSNTNDLLKLHSREQEREQERERTRK